MHKNQHTHTELNPAHTYVETLTSRWFEVHPSTSIVFPTTPLLIVRIYTTLGTKSMARIVVNLYYLWGNGPDPQFSRFFGTVCLNTGLLIYISLLICISR
ncbi:hypothetical protein F4815DRAFT_56193 [Daldinia loculata]|nr:hypothetical protein F4815DRAFT_56193 [Daldinia loculata]